MRRPSLLQAGKRASRRGGFTLVEMLVVLGIILVLISLLLPSINRAYKISVRSRMQADLAAVSAALEAYRQDHGDYPRLSAAPTTGDAGAVLLCRALIAPGNQAEDGAGAANDATLPFPGFRTRLAVGGIAQGRVYGPYLDVDKFKWGADASGNTVVWDKYKHPILYYPGRKTNTTLAKGYLGDTGMFDPNYNISFLSLAAIQNLLHAKSDGSASTPQYTGNFLLWAMGPDEIFGPPDTSKPVSPSNRCDDVANFDRSEY